MDYLTQTCPYCDYDLRGCPAAARCPECGRAMSKRRRRHGASLAREPFAVILRCLWRMAVAGGLSALFIGMWVAVLLGGDVREWGLVLVPIPVALSTYLRGSRWLAAPPVRSASRDRLLRRAARWAGAVLFVLGLWTTGWAAFGSVDIGIVLVVNLPATVLIGTIGVWAGMGLDEWVHDERAERLHGLAMWMVVLTVLVLAAMIVLRLLLGGLVEGPSTIILFAGVAWWLLILLGDLSVVGALLWCLRHRAHYEEILVRNQQRDAAEQADFARRREAMDAE